MCQALCSKTHRNKTSPALRSSRSGRKHRCINRPLARVWRETPLLHHCPRPLLKPGTHLWTSWASREGTTRSTPTPWHMPARGGRVERVRGLAVGSTKTLDAKTAKHSLTQRCPSPRASGLAIGFPWPVHLRHPKPPLPATITTAIQKKSELTCKDHRAL